jgi:hypothetical protein
MKTIPIQLKTDEFGPLIFRTKDGVTHFYQYYGIMPRMGDEHHDLYLVVEGCSKGDMCLWNVQHEYQLSEADSNDALLHYKIIATTNQRLHKEYKIPLISDEIVIKYAYEDQYGGLKEVIIETESIYVEPEGIHSNRGYDKIVPKLNEDGEVTMYHEPVKIVDWNQFSLEELISHLEETFKFDSSGTAKAVNELIRAYRSKGASNSVELYEKDKEVEWIKERIISEKKKHESAGLDWELIAAAKIFSTLSHRKEKCNSEEPNICIQTGRECGFPCFSPDECKPMSERNLEMKLEQIFDERAKKNMIKWNISGFKQSYRKLFKSIMESLKIASNG